jgi:cation diffusion facilitator CzcD-associated flavoprotein CzcO
MSRRQAHLFSRLLRPSRAPKDGRRQPDFEVAIVGAGFAGIGMAIQLKQAGIDAFVLLEQADRIGGTWRANTYPGCACDVPSHMYSFSWERKADWSRTYASQPEILSYLQHCADKYGIRPHIRLQCALREARFDEADDLWQVHTADGESFSTRILVSATGALSRPALPRLPGLARFQGVAFHSAEWRHDCDLSGKRVAVIGTGASAIQFVPRIAPLAAQLTLFQRTPAWVLPKPDREFEAKTKTLFRRLPLAMGLFRTLIYWRQELLGLGFFKPQLMEKARNAALRNMQRHIKEPELQAKLTPDYAIGCKRILLSNDYFPALARPNVHLVTRTIAEVREHGIIDDAGVEHAADVIVYGTGFLVNQVPLPMRIVGRDGVDLNDAWRDNGPQAYLGMMSAGFPNLFMLLGPNTGLGHHSVLFMLEQQIRYLIACLRHMRADGKTSIEVRAQAQREFNDDLQRRLRTAVWGSGCNSWYLDRDGRNTALWPGLTVEYWRALRKVRHAHYHFA